MILVDYRASRALVALGACTVLPRIPGTQIPGNFLEICREFAYFLPKYLKFPALFSEMALLNIAGNSGNNCTWFGCVADRSSPTRYLALASSRAALYKYPIYY
jgi:hypothetical protein